MHLAVLSLTMLVSVLSENQPCLRARLAYGNKGIDNGGVFAARFVPCNSASGEKTLLYIPNKASIRESEVTFEVNFNAHVDILAGNFTTGDLQVVMGQAVRKPENEYLCNGFTIDVAYCTFNGFKYPMVQPTGDANPGCKALALSHYDAAPSDPDFLVHFTPCGWSDEITLYIRRQSNKANPFTLVNIKDHAELLFALHYTEADMSTDQSDPQIFEAWKKWVPTSNGFVRCSGKNKETESCYFIERVEAGRSPISEHVTLWPVTDSA